jgi:methionine-rich copper-binding protein CopC
LRTTTLRSNPGRYNLAIVALLAFAALALVLAESGVAFAHAHLKTATILPDATVSAAPATLTLTFGEDTSTTQTKLSVTDASGKVVDKGDLKVDGANATVSLNTLADGKYTVTYRSFTEDDSGIINGSYTFTVASSGAASAGNASKATEQASGGGAAPAGAPATGQGGLSGDNGSVTLPALLLFAGAALFAGAILLIRQKRRA